MKKLFYLFCFHLFIFGNAQDRDEKTDLDVMRAPSSPSSNLLGISTTDIDKPTDISAFTVSIQSASTSYSKFPSNYALDFSPYFLFMKKGTDFTTNGLQSDSFKDIFKQSLVISAAISNPDSTAAFYNYKSTYAALGFKFSVLRGEYDTPTKEKLDEISNLQAVLTNLNTENIASYLENNDDEYKKILKKRERLVKGIVDPKQLERITGSEEYKKYGEELSLMLENFGENRKKDEQEKIRSRISSIASEFQLNRVGFSWDFNGGISGEFRNRNFNNGKIFNAGIWTNFGYTNSSGIAFLGLIRYLYNPQNIYALNDSENEFENASTLDAGGRIAYSKSQSKFSVSIEAVYRSVVSNHNVDPNWKFLLNADYSILKNQKLTFSFGRNFDGTTTKDGNLIAALTFIKGFGNKR